MLKILYVDDEKINLQLFEINFNHKYNVITCMSGFEALDILKENPDISIVISDMKMPQMNGLEFILKARMVHPNMKYFILTGFDITDEIKQALELNIIDKYFSKPFNISEINKTIKEALE